MYRELIDRSMGAVYQAGVATKILQYMGKIRNESDMAQARRWVMELLQNARDLAGPEGQVRVQFLLEEDAMTFRHTGKVFRVKDILSIINQVSSKNPGEGVGQFGTGFMTTYQLSERVEIHSVLQEENLPGREFRITLDRSGTCKEEILGANDRSLEELKRADEGEGDTGDWIKDGFATEFRYCLETEQSRRIAETGMRDLADTVFYVMLFSDRIESVELLYCLPERQERILYQRGGEEALAGGLGALTLTERSGDGAVRRHRMIYLREEGLTLAAERGEEGFLPFSERTPKLFVDFPLIGAEEFPFPVVLNHLGLHTNEPRSGISLVDNIGSEDARVNREIMDRAVILYGRFLRELGEEKGLENLVRVREWRENKEWSEDWVKRHLYQALYQILEDLPLLPTAEGRLPLNCPKVSLVRFGTAEEREGIRRLCAPLRDGLVPLDETDWAELFAAYGADRHRVIGLGALLEEASRYLRERLEEERMPAMEWCRILYRLGLENPETATGIRMGMTAIFPSQNAEDWEEKRLYTSRQLFRDPEIPEILKDVAEKLAQLDSLSAPDLRRTLLHQSFSREDVGFLPEYPLTNLTEYIRLRSDRLYRVTNFVFYKERYLRAWTEAWQRMVSSGPDEDFYGMCRILWKEALPARQRLEDGRIQSSFWDSTYRSVMNRILEWVAESPSLAELHERLDSGLSREEFYRWLNCLYRKVNQYTHSGQHWNSRILPDQKGAMRMPGELKLDRIKEAELKEIADCFRELESGCDIYAQLLDKGIRLEGWGLSEYRDDVLMMRINGAVEKLLAEGTLSQAEILYQEACTRLLGWIQEHLEQAKSGFPGFWQEESQMRLLAPGAAVRLQRKAKSLDFLMEELGTENPEELVRLVRELKQGTGTGGSCQSGYISYRDHIGYMEEDLEGLAEAEREDFLREIGEAGEMYAFHAVKEFLLEKGYRALREEAGRILLETAEGAGAEIWRPDTDSYHQEGWDIQVTLLPAGKALEAGTSTERGPAESGLAESEPAENGLAERGSTGNESAESGEVYRLEVKTHTPRSVAGGLLALSDSQMKLAAGTREHYLLLSVVYDYRRKHVLRMNHYQDVVSCMAEGRLYSAEGRYVLREG